MGNNVLEYKIRPNIISKGGCRKLNEIFNHFYDIIDEHCKYEEGKDAPYWYNERATLSCFAGAIWRSGELVLEEFSTEKFDLESGNEKKGRADLWFSCSDMNFICEAKQYARQPSTVLSKMMESARRDVANTGQNFPHSAQLALTFWIPWIKKDIELEADFDSIHSSLKTALKDEVIDMYCFVAPQSARGIRETEDSSSFPCVIILGKLEFLPKEMGN